MCKWIDHLSVCETDAPTHFPSGSKFIRYYSNAYQMRMKNCCSLTFGRNHYHVFEACPNYNNDIINLLFRVQTTIRRRKRQHQLIVPDLNMTHFTYTFHITPDEYTYVFNDCRKNVCLFPLLSFCWHRNSRDDVTQSLNTTAQHTLDSLHHALNQ